MNTSFGLINFSVYEVLIESLTPRFILSSLSKFFALLVIQNNPTGKVQAILFVSYFSFYLAFLHLVANKFPRFVFGICALGVIPSLLVSIYFLLTGAEMDYHVFASILDTHSGELAEFLKSPLASKIILVVVLFIGACLLFFFKRKRLVPAWLKINYAVPCLFFWGLAASCLFFNSQHNIAKFYPLKEASLFYRYYDEVHRKVKKYQKLSYEFDGDLIKENKVLVIFALGESARKDKLGLYTSGVETTPFFDEFSHEHPSNFVLYEDVVAAASYTRVSVPSILSTSPTQRVEDFSSKPSILKVIKAAGRESILISNQNRKGFHDSFISAYMEDAKRLVYLTELKKSYDMDLVPYFDEEIQNPSQNSRLIILHFAGSHFRYSSRYPKSEEFFKPDTHMEEYLNSIRYTDKVLGEIVTRMMNLGHPAILLYMPDHGEYLNDYRDGFYDHGTRNFLTRFEIDVPFFVVFNNAYAEKYPDEVSRLSSRALIPISHDNLSHTILGAMGIYGSNYDAQYDLTAEGFNQMPRYIVERSNKVALLEEVEFNEEKFDGIVIQED